MKRWKKAKESDFALAKALLAKGCKQKQVALVVGYSSSTITQWNKHDTLQEYSQSIRERDRRVKAPQMSLGFEQPDQRETLQGVITTLIKLYDSLGAL